MHRVPSSHCTALLPVDALSAVDDAVILIFA